MPLFAFVGYDVSESAKRRELNRAAHLEHLRSLDRQKRIAFAGPLRNDAGDASIGAIIVIDTADLAAARDFFARDPYILGGVYERHTISPFKLAFPESK